MLEQHGYPRLAKFPTLANFLGSSFRDADLEGLTDDAVARRDVSESGPEERLRIIEQGKALLSDRDFPYEEVGRRANRYFRDVEEARRWLTRILAAVEASPSGHKKRKQKGGPC
jgi:hypothetical protein